MCCRRKTALTWEKNSSKMTISSKFVAVKAVIPVEIAVMNGFISNCLDCDGRIAGIVPEIN